MELTFEGKVIFVGEEKKGQSATTGKEWRKNEFVVEQTEGQYPRKCCFTTFNDTCNIIPNAGDVVKVTFEVNAREYNGRYYNDVRAYKIEKAGDAAILKETQNMATAKEKATPTGKAATEGGALQDNADALPF